jgi:hypothetical protein
VVSTKIPSPGLIPDIDWAFLNISRKVRSMNKEMLIFLNGKIFLSRFLQNKEHSKRMNDGI